MFGVYLIGPVTASVLPIDCNDAKVHDEVTKAVGRKDHYLNIPRVHDFVAVVGSERSDEMVEENTVAENRIVMTDDASTVWVHVTHRDLCDQSDHPCCHVQCEKCKQDYRLINQFHCD